MRDDHLTELHEASNQRLFDMIPADQMERVTSSYLCDIDPSFLGFVGVYERLAQIIPLDWTVIDMGCAYAPQAFFFERHREYIGVDILTPLENRFYANNSRHFFMSIKDFINKHIAAIELKSSFAICSYVPPWGGDNRKMVRDAFQNVFTFYPHLPKGSEIFPHNDLTPVRERATP
jgi:hypothetical protein